MTRPDSPQGSRKRSALPTASAALLLLAVVLGLWWSLARGPGDSEAPGAPGGAASREGASAPTPRAMPGAPAPPRGVRAPARRIPDQGRLSVSRAALREGDVLALGLELPDALRGTGPRPVTIVGVTGRVLRTEALPVDGSDGGLRLEIDPDWLLPGRYLIEVQTEGGAPLRLRRYVLEVTEEGAGPG